MRFAVALVVACLLAPGCGRATTPTNGLAEVTHVVDGDTIDVEIGGRDERIRLIGIDTPETKKPNSPIECYGPEASAFTEELLQVGARVRLERDIVGRDDYGRLLGYVYLVDDDGTETFANLEIVEQGYAQPLTFEPNSAHAEEFADAALAAERANRGMWGVCSS